MPVVGQDQKDTAPENAIVLSDVAVGAAEAFSPLKAALRILHKNYEVRLDPSLEAHF